MGDWGVESEAAVGMDRADAGDTYAVKVELQPDGVPWPSGADVARSVINAVAEVKTVLAMRGYTDVDIRVEFFDFNTALGVAGVAIT